MYKNHDDTVAGAAFLITPQHLLTCAHVVNFALGRDGAQDCPIESFWIDFPGIDNSKIEVRVLNHAWFPRSQSYTLTPDHSLDDIAILDILSPSLPLACKPVTLCRTEAKWCQQHKSFKVNGFPQDRVEKSIKGIMTQLQKRKLSRAQKYLKDLLKEQQRKGTEDKYLAMTLCQVAAAALEQGFMDWCQDLYQQASEFNPDDPVPHTGLAELQKARGDMQAAEKAYREVIQGWPNDVVAQNGLAEVLKARGDRQAAEEAYREVIQRWPNEVVARNGLAEVLKARGDTQAAEEAYREIIQRWPNEVVARTGLAEVLKARGDTQAAEEAYREIIQRWSNNVVARNGLAEVLKARGDTQAAEEAYREVIQRWPNEVVARNGLAEVLKARGDMQAAEEAYREVIQRWPDDAIARNGLANLLRQLKRWQEALVILPAPQHVQGLQQHRDLHMHCMILLGMGRAEEAGNLLQAGLKQSPAEQVPYYRQLLLLVDLRTQRHAALSAQAQSPELMATLEGKVVSLHAFAVNRELDRARRLATTLKQAQKMMSRTTLQAFQEVKTTFCDLDKNCTPSPEALDRLFAYEADMLLEAA